MTLSVVNIEDVLRVSGKTGRCTRILEQIVENSSTKGDENAASSLDF